MTTSRSTYKPDNASKGLHRNAYWDDLRAPASAINPPGAASDPDVEASTGMLLFDSISTELVFIALQMPHAWIEGSAIYPHLHWTKTSSAAGNVLWSYRYRIADIGEVLSAWSAPAGETLTTGPGDSNTDSQHLITRLEPISMTGKTLSSMLLFELSRLGGDGTDTYGADARLLEFDIHYQLNAPGSVEEFRKYEPLQDA